MGLTRRESAGHHGDTRAFAGVAYAQHLQPRATPLQREAAARINAVLAGS